MALPGSSPCPPPAPRGPTGLGVRLSILILLLVPDWAGLWATGAAQPLDPPMVGARPNVLWIVADDLGIGDVAAFGSGLHTPNIDSLAANGVKFAQWYAAAPVCTPSRYSMMTGKHPLRSRGGLAGVLRWSGRDDGAGLRPTDVTVASVLNQSGYSTALVGKWHLGHGAAAHQPPAHGFGHFYGPLGCATDHYTHSYGPVPDWYRMGTGTEAEGHSTDLLTAEAVRLLHAYARHGTLQPRAGPAPPRPADPAHHPDPFCLCLSYTAPHVGVSLVSPHSKYLDHGLNSSQPTLQVGRPRTFQWQGRAYSIANTLQPTPGDLRALRSKKDIRRRYYAATVRGLDEGVGRVLAVLRETGLWNDTLVILTSDHGADTRRAMGGNGALRGDKFTVNEGGIRVPALLQWPAHVAAGHVVEDVVWGGDVMPTLGRMAGANLQALDLDGQSFDPLLSPREGSETREVPPRQLYWQFNDKQVGPSTPTLRLAGVQGGCVPVGTVPNRWD